MSDPQSALLTPDEMKALIAQNYFVHNPDAVDKLQRPELDLFNSINRENASGRDATSRRVDGNIASGIPILGSLAPEDALLIPQLAKAAAGTVIGGAKGFVNSAPGFWEGIKGSLKGAFPSLGEAAAPGTVEAGKAVGTRTMPQSAEEYGGPRLGDPGSPTTLRKPPDFRGPVSIRPVPSNASPMGDPAFEGSEQSIQELLDSLSGAPKAKDQFNTQFRDQLKASSHGPDSSYWNGRSYSGMGGDAQTNAKRAKGAAMRAHAKRRTPGADE